ncbi:MAG: EamA/RhaT family transporter [Ruminococcaceae bacterium]|nr:EamA/RhaT family transporter [Oscillospiraceae bacterium]
MSKIKLITAMLIFGTIGVFVKFIPFPSPVLAFCRGIIGALFLLAAMYLSHKKPDWGAIRRNLVLLIVSGGAIGINWILLFEAYRYTTVATATVCYYLSPVLVMALSPLVLKEKLTVRKVLCIIGALLGMLFVSGVFGGQSGARDGVGILLGCGAAVFYASVVLMNKFLRDIPPTESTFVQLASAALVVLPYGILVGDFAEAAAELSVTAVLLTAVVAFIHTGLAYRLYFDSITDLSGQTIALCSYIDPACAIVLSMTLLGEPMNPLSLFGAVLILGCTMLGEIGK